ncbi:Ig-like domain-containing protein, partial [Methanobacterium formicicum]
MFILAFAFVLTILGTSAAAVNETGNTNNTTLDVTGECSGSDPIITGTVTVNEYGHVRPLEGATIIVNSTTSGKVVGSTTTDANGYYSVNFYSTETSFNVIANYIGCTPITRTVTVSNGPNYPTDPNKYGTANFELTPKTATLSSMGNGQTVYIQGQNKNGFAGVINVNVGGTTYVAYCIDLFTPISMGDTLLVNGPLPGTAGDLPTEVDWGKVSYILNNYSPSSSTEAAAIQCAIWYFTSVHYGAYNASNPVGTYYQYMTAPNDGRIGGATGSTAVRDRAWQIINAAVSMQYPYSITVTPESITVLNGQSVTVTATVRDIDGNPLPGVRVYFQKTRGTLSSTSGVTDANGQVSVTLSSIGTTRNAIVTAYVSGNYGNLLYDDQYASVRKQNLVARNVLPLTISDFCIINTAVQADVTLTQTVNGGSSATVNVGDTVTYRVTATNANQNTATGILISDIIPAGLSGVTVTPSAGTTYYNGIWTIPTLNKLASATLTITGTATPAMAGLTTNNTANRTAQNQYNSQPTSVSASVYTKKADVAVTQTVNGGSSATANVGDTIIYIITAANNGLDAATNLRITDLLPSGLTDLSYTITGPGTYNLGTGLWNIGTLNSGATTILTITGKVTAAMAGLTTTNYANRTNQTEYNSLPASTNTTVYTKKADLSLSQTVNGQSSGTINGNVGDSVTFQITATNNGPDAATNINLRDIIPGGLTGITVTPSVGTYDSNTGIWTIPSLANGASATLTINGILGSSLAGQTITNTGNVISQTEYDPTTPTTTSIPVYTKIADVAVTQTVNGGSSATVNVNDTVTYIITAVNNGVDAATNLQITDIIPSGLTDLTYTITGTGTYNPSTGLWNIGTLNSGATTILTITGKVTAAMAGLTTTNYANRTNQTEYNPSPASTSTTVYTKLSDPIITQTVNGQNTGTVKVNVGDDVTFVVNAYCSGPDDATNIQIRDIIPAGLTDVTVTPSVGTYDSNTGIWTIPFLEKYTSATLTISGKAGTSMAGTSITNRAQEIYQTEYNPAPGDSTSIPVYTKMADVILTQTGNYQSNVVNFVVTATNNGPDTATNIKITDLIPSGLTGVTVTPSIGTYDSNTGVWTIPELLNGASATLTITGNATPQTTVTNTAEKTSQTEYDPTSDISTLSIYISDVDISVQNYPWYLNAITGEQLYQYTCGNSPVMTIDIRNLGPDDATGVTIEYKLGTGL